MLRDPSRRPPGQARRRTVARMAVTVMLGVAAAVATAVASAGLSEGVSARTPLAPGTHVQLGPQLIAFGTDAVDGLRATTTAPSASGQRATPGALPALVPVVLPVAVLFAVVAVARPIRPMAALALPLRRGPPWDAFSR